MPRGANKLLPDSLLRVAKYRFVFVAAQNGFNGDVFSSVDTLNQLRRNRICRPKIGGFP
jgi:hypothetical protein